MSTTTTTTPATPATPAKLRDGSWGARTASSITVGDAIRITTRAGKSWDAQVIAIVWAGPDAAIVRTSSSSSSSKKRSPAKKGGRCRCCGHALRDAPHHRAMGGYCGECAFDEFDC